MNPLDKFEISIRRKDGAVIAAAPQLGLYATATDIHGRVDALGRKKGGLSEDSTRGGQNQRFTPVAAGDPNPPGRVPGLPPFQVKVGHVVVFVAVAIVITTNLIATKL